MKARSKLPGKVVMLDCGTESIAYFEQKRHESLARMIAELKGYEFVGNHFLLLHSPGSMTIMHSSDGAVILTFSDPLFMALSELRAPCVTKSLWLFLRPIQMQELVRIEYLPNPSNHYSGDEDRVVVVSS